MNKSGRRNEMDNIERENRHLKAREMPKNLLKQWNLHEKWSKFLLKAIDFEHKEGCRRMQTVIQERGNQRPKAQQTAKDAIKQWNLLENGRNS